MKRRSFLGLMGGTVVAPALAKVQNTYQAVAMLSPDSSKAEMDQVMACSGGKSAYQIAREMGETRSPEEWIRSLVKR
jgi:hypothetical protein